MISEVGFTVLLAVLWLSEFGFVLLVTYQVVRDGFTEVDDAGVNRYPTESRAFTYRSLLAWTGFGVAMTLFVVLGR